MLAELAVYLTTPASRSVHRSGAIRDAVALWARGRRCAAAWAEHEDRSRAAFRRAIDATPRRRTAVVLGSGLLRDVPMPELVGGFHRVILVDIVHLSVVRLAAVRNRWRNVSFVTRDLSGYEQLVERELIRAATGQADIGGRLDPLGFLRRIDDLDLVLSANLLSQIAVGAERRLARPGGRAGLMPDDAVARLVEAHLDGLAALACRTCLVTDVVYEIRDRAGELVDGVDLLHGVPAPPADDRWTWPVVPFGEEGADFTRIHTVIAAQDVALDLGDGIPD